MKTAIQELMELNDFLKIMGVTIEWEKYLEKEKEQIIDFANSFYDDCVTEGGSLKQSAEDYYKETFNQNK